MTTEETRTTPLPVECRLSALGTSRKVGGIGIAFGKNSHLLPGVAASPPLPGGFVERVVPSFCDGARAEDFKSIVVQFNHDPRTLLGRVDNNTAGCSVDERGLDYWVDCPDWGHPPNVPAMVARGDLRHSSFSFSNAKAEWSLDDDGIPLRTLVAGDIRELSPVVHPAYPDSTVALRDLASQMDAPFEDIAALAESRSLHKLFTRSDRPPSAAPKVVPAPAFTGRNGAEALAECRAMAPVMGRSRMLETQAQRWPAYQVAEWDAMPSALTPLEAERRELAEARRDVARLKDSAGLLLAELARAEVERASARAEDYLASKSGQPLSGKTALRLTKEMERP
jgi:HK97 family phage prohead protease